MREGTVNGLEQPAPADYSTSSGRGGYHSVTALFYGIYPVEGIGVFRVPKNGDARNKKPPALRVETKRCTKKSPFRYNRVVQALL